MLHPSTQKLIDRLAEMTATKKIDWTEYQNGGVSYATEGYSVVLTAAPVELVILSSAEKELERATVDQLMATAVSEGGTYSDLVTGMHAEALRFARGTETAISTLLNQLGTPAADSAETEPVSETAELVEDPESPLREDEADDTEMLQTEAFSDLTASPEAEDADATADTESMTAAVARLADEVNEREEQAASDEVDEVIVEAPVEADDDIEAAQSEETPSAPADSEPEFTYIPFGLTSEAELPEEPVAMVEEIVAEPEAAEDEVSKPQTVFTPTVISPIANDDEPQSQVEDAPTDLAGITASALDQADTTEDGGTTLSSSTTGFAGIGAGTGLLRTPVSEEDVVEDSEPETVEADTETPGRFVIDATDDVVDFDPAELADLSTDDVPESDHPDPTQNAEPVEAQAEEESNDDAESERPRFNPWS